METVEVHSKAYLVRWLHGDADTIISWKVIPEKRSVNFGVFLHNETHAAGFQMDKSGGNIKEKLEQAGFKPLTEDGLIRVDAKSTVEGQAALDKPIMLAFIFDNTFSISQAKRVQFWFNVYPKPHDHTQGAATPDGKPVVSSSVASQPQTDAGNSSSKATASAANSALSSGAVSSPQVSAPSSPAMQPVNDEGTTEFPHVDSASAKSASGVLQTSQVVKPNHDNGSGSSLRKMSTNSRTVERRSTITSMKSPTTTDESPRLPTRSNTTSSISENFQISPDGNFVTGYMYKKRRKQFQGFARRYFVLDKKKGLLSYYLNSRSQNLRGVMPLKITEITPDEKSFQVTLDSGMERWTLKAYDAKSYMAWHDEVRKLQSSNLQKEEDQSSTTSPDGSNSVAAAAAAAALSSSSASVSAPAKSRKHLPAPDASIAGFAPLNALHELVVSLPEGNQKRSFEHAYVSLLKEAKYVSKRLSDKVSDSSITKLALDTSSGVASNAKEVVETYLDILRKEFNSNNFILVGGFAFIMSCFVGFRFTVTFLTLIGVSVAGGLVTFNTHKPAVAASSPSSSPSSPLSDGVSRTADDNASMYSSLLDNQSEIGQQSTRDSYSPESSEYDMSDSEEDEPQSGSSEGVVKYVHHKEDPSKDKQTENPPIDTQQEQHHSLCPLPHDPVKRRNNVTGPTQAPPSLMALLKKAKQKGNLGAPITTNEPLSGVQFVAELFEYADLLDKAAAAPPKSQLRTITVALFAVARISALRIKERSLRKPFTPLLGESYEMVREDLGIRFIGEKVMHKPEVIATQTESRNWTVHFTSRPHTKMWAKSAQLTDVGTLCVTFPDGESVSFINPEMFIRNIIGGERYIEPVGTVTVDSSSGVQAVVEFKAGGMFSGRSEDVTIQCGSLSYEGKWTDEIRSGHELVWKVKPTVHDPLKHYGWTVFCAQLNEITELEKDKLPPNDSRLRPDLRLYEHQTDNEKAEAIKLDLEQHQRERRAVMEQSNKQHEPFFFKKTKDAKGHYVLYNDENRNYWKLRENQNWSNLPDYFK